jgi:hypothetical protein
MVPSYGHQKEGETIRLVAPHHGGLLREFAVRPWAATQESLY